MSILMFCVDFNCRVVWFCQRGFTVSSLGFVYFTKLIFSIAILWRKLCVTSFIFDVALGYLLVNNGRKLFSCTRKALTSCVCWLLFFPLWCNKHVRQAVINSRCFRSSTCSSTKRCWRRCCAEKLWFLRRNSHSTTTTSSLSTRRIIWLPYRRNSRWASLTLISISCLRAPGARVPMLEITFLVYQQ